MISLFIIYSNDRIKPLKITASLLKQMKGYEKWQKLLITDGKVKNPLDDFNCIEVPRINNKFCWGRMWDVGVFSSKNDIIWYLDSDRLLPENYAECIEKNIKEDSFIFTSHHYQMLTELNEQECKYWTNLSEDDFFKDLNYFGKFRFELKYKNPINTSGKNVMSGNTAFLKNTYIKLGGVDQWYCGHGAFADTDFHWKAAKNNCQFVDLKLKELHYFHNKIENGKIISKEEYEKMIIENYVYFCKKWDLPKKLVSNLIKNTSLDDNFIEKVWND